MNHNENLLSKNRRDYCYRCVLWRGSCSHRNYLPDSGSCPDGKFNQHNSLQDLPVTTWSQVWSHFLKSMAIWVADGLPLADQATHDRRYQICKSCPKYSDYRCQQCHCFAYVKAKLATEKCPIRRWT